MTAEPSLFLGVHLGHTDASLIWCDVVSTDHALTLPHASVDVDIFDGDPKWAIGWSHEPAVDFPAEVEEDEKRTGEVELEECCGVLVGTADWVQSDVELGHERDEAYE